jgi:uncharacterized protein (DUF2235 family)
MGRNVVLLFDGTWSNRQDQTNVLRMRESIDSTGEEDPLQLSRYIGGAGTTWHDPVTGELLGRGLCEHIKQGYAWLARHYRPSDRIFLFGFSRGAYVARSCVGLLSKCGLVGSHDEQSIEAAYALYCDKTVAPEDARAAEFRAAHSREVRVRFVGVWDTVGALGVPAARIPCGSQYYRWGDTQLPPIIDHAYHAIAVDEHRRHYRPALWCGPIPAQAKEVEQRWFAGAHGNVGGAYDKKPADCLAKIPLRWMQDKAEAAGLHLLWKTNVVSSDCLADLNDSYRESAFGLYRLVGRRFQRPFGEGVNETVDASVWARWNALPDYRPASLGSHPDRPLLLITPESA